MTSPGSAACLLAVFLLSPALPPLQAQEDAEETPAKPRLDPIEGMINDMQKEADSRQALGHEIMQMVRPGKKQANFGDNLINRDADIDAHKTPRPPRPEAEAPDEGPMELSDARINFAGVVESYVRGLSTNGFWLHKDAKTGKELRLAYRRVDDRRMREVGRNRFSSCVLFRQSAGGPADLDITVDFGGDHWRVADVVVHSLGGRKDAPPAARKAP